MDLDRDSNPWVDPSERGPPPGAMIPGTSGMALGAPPPPPPGAVHPGMAPGTPNAVPPPGSQVSTTTNVASNGASTLGSGQGKNSFPL